MSQFPHNTGKETERNKLSPFLKIIMHVFNYFWYSNGSKYKTLFKNSFIIFSAKYYLIVTLPMGDGAR